MAVELIIPALGESISEATIAKWLKQVGEAVALDEPVAQLETDKVTVDLPAPEAGVLSAQRFTEGATVRVGDSIGTIDPSGAPASAAAPAAKAAAAPQAPAAAPQAPAAPAAPPPAQAAPPPPPQAAP